MAKAQISGDVWYRYIHDTWENKSGYRTDIPISILSNSSVKRAFFILDDGRGIGIQMRDLKPLLQSLSTRAGGKTTPFNVDPHSSTVNGLKVPMEIITED